MKDVARWLAQLGDTDASAGALRALAGIGPEDAAAVPLLVDALRTAPADKRWAVASALGCIGEPAAAGGEVLAPYLASDDEPLRRQAALALGRVGGPAAAAAVPALEGMLGDDSPMARAAAASALLLLAPPAPAAASLLAELASSADVALGYWAACGLVEGLGRVPALRPAVVALLDHRNVEIQELAAHALANAST